MKWDRYDYAGCGCVGIAYFLIYSAVGLKAAAALVFFFAGILLFFKRDL